MRILDTNILLHYPNILEDNVNEKFVITIRVLEELDNLKTSKNADTAFEARRASHVISNHLNQIHFLNKRKDKKSVDNELIYFAKKYRYTLVTNDLNIQIKCFFKKVACENYNKETIYTGVRYEDLDLENEQDKQYLANLFEGKITIDTMKENEFLIVRNRSKIIIDENNNKNYEILGCFINKFGQLIHIDKKFLKNNYNNTIYAKNAEQECLLELLKDNSISILFATGEFGTGKSFLLLNYILQELDKGHINKLVYVPNNSFNENTREIAALPGDLLSKEQMHMGTLVDILGEIRMIDMIQKGLIEVVPISIMRGRNFNNSIILVNEAQNLTEEHVKLLIGRCGENTRIFFDGDIKQTDGKVFRNKNGLKLLTKLKDSERYGQIFGMVKLKSIERSFTAQASKYLDEIF